MDSPVITIGMAHYDDYDGAFFTIQALHLEYRSLPIEFLVVDNSPHSLHGEGIRDLLAKIGGKYVPLPSPVGTSPPRDLVFRSASAPIVLCLDSHVLLVPGAVHRLVAWFRSHDDSRDIVSGPMLADNLSLYASHPNPAADYAEAVQWVEDLRAAEVGFNPDCHTTLLTHGAKTAKVIIFVDGYGSCPASFKELGAQFYERGYNVLVVPLPYNGLADRMNTEQAKLRAEDLVRYADEVVDIGRGLGDHLTMIGISCGGLVTGWAAQQRQDVDLAVLISPGFGFKVVPDHLSKLTSRAVNLLPNMYIWDNPELKADDPPYHNYPRISARALGQILRLSLATQALMRQQAPAAGSILVVTNLSEPGVDNTVIGKVVEVWRAYRSADVQTYQFPADLHLPHGMIDVQEPDQNVAVVYPKLLELIDR